MFVAHVVGAWTEPKATRKETRKWMRSIQAVVERHRLIIIYVIFYNRTILKKSVCEECVMVRMVWNNIVDIYFKNIELISNNLEKFLNNFLIIVLFSVMLKIFYILQIHCYLWVTWVLFLYFFRKYLATISYMRYWCLAVIKQ